MTGKELQAILHNHKWTHGDDYGAEFVSKDRLHRCIISRELSYVWFYQRFAKNLDWLPWYDFRYENKSPEQIENLLLHGHKP